MWREIERLRQRELGSRERESEMKNSHFELLILFYYIEIQSICVPGPSTQCAQRLCLEFLPRFFFSVGVKTYPYLFIFSQ